MRASEVSKFICLFFALFHLALGPIYSDGQLQSQVNNMLECLFFLIGAIYFRLEEMKP